MSHGFEAMLLRWAETSNGGATIVLQLSDAADLEQFKSITQAKKGKDGHMVGQRLMIGWAEIGEGEKPIVESLGLADDGREALRLTTKGGPLARLAGMWCNDAVFQRWIVRSHAGTEGLSEQDDPRENAAILIRSVCGIESRAQLDSDVLAKERFDNFIRIPYSLYLKENG